MNMEHWFYLSEGRRFSNILYTHVCTCRLSELFSNILYTHVCWWSETWFCRYCLEVIVSTFNREVKRKLRTSTFMCSCWWRLYPHTCYLNTYLQSNKSSKVAQIWSKMAGRCKIKKKYRMNNCVNPGHTEVIK